MYLTFTRTPFAKTLLFGRAFLASSECKKVLLIMRMTIVILLAGFLQVSATGRGQTITLKAKNSPAEAVFRSIEKKSGFTFVYFRKDLEQIGRINISAVNTPLKEVLDQCFETTPFTYVIDEKNIIVKSRGAEEFINISEKLAAAPPYSGIIRGDNGLPLAGVNVMIKGTGKGTVTDSEGRFKIEANAGDILIFSSIGYKTHEIMLSDATNLSLVLSIESSLIDTAVVNYVSTGYQSLPKERVTGAFSHVTHVDLDKQIGAGSIDEKFKNLLPGVLSSGGTVTVRGKSSINANQNVLIVVDGFATNLSLNTLNPNDIESITVLRDAAAASIWGARASNGVIVIVTKKGKNVNGKPVISATSTLKIEHQPNLADLRLATSAQMVDVELEALNKGWYNLNSAENNPGYSRVFEIYRKEKNGEITGAEANSQYNLLRNTNAFDQKDFFLHNGVFQQYDVSLSGSTAQNNYYLSVNYQNNKPYTKGVVDNRFIFFVKNSYQFLPKFRLDALVNVSYSKAALNSVSMGDFLGQRPYESFVDANNNYVPEYLGGGASRTIETNELWKQKGYYDWNPNVKRDFDNADAGTTSFSPRLSLGLNYDIMKGLNIESSLQHERTEYAYDEYLNDETYYTRNLINTFTVQQPGGALLYHLPPGTIYNAVASNLSKITWRNQLSLNRDWGMGKHKVNAILGTELHRDVLTTRTHRYFNYNKKTLTYSLIDEDELAKGVTNYNGQTQMFSPIAFPVTEDQNRFFSTFFNGAYTFNDKYTLSASARMDKSNLFGAATNDKIAPLYSAGAAWNISKEKFFNSNFVNDLRIRATTGVNGNVERTTSKVLTATAMRNLSGTGEEYLKIIWPENKSLRWESTKTTNFGLDARVFENKVSVTLDYYIKKSYDLLGYVAADPSLGFDKVYKNTASVENKGFDVRITARPLNGQFQWSPVLNLSFNKNEVTEVYTPQINVDNHLTGGRGREVKGSPIDYLYSYRWAGLTNEGAPQVYDNTGKAVTDVATAQPTVEWLEYSGTRVPPYFGSFINSFSWKGFTLTPIITFEFGDVMRLPTTYLRTVGSINSDIDKRWRKPGDEKITDLPGLYASMNEPYALRQFYASANNKVASTSFIRLSNLSLAYTVPSSVTGRIFSNLQILTQASNIAIWKKNKNGIDPEAIDRLTGALWFAPVTTYTFGIKAEL